MNDDRGMIPRVLVLLALFLLAGCNGDTSEAELEAIDRNRADAADPAVTAALDDPIMTDRDLSVGDNSRRVRNVPGPAEAIYPPRDKANARALAGLEGLNPPGCDRGFAYGRDWARRLPATFPMSPGATLIEAAGNDKPGCRARVAVFRSPASPRAIVDWYAARASAAGYTATPQTRGSDLVLAGQQAGGASYYIIVSPRDDVSEVAMIATGGR